MDFCAGFYVWLQKKIVWPRLMRVKSKFFWKQSLLFATLFCWTHGTGKLSQMTTSGLLHWTRVWWWKCLHVYTLHSQYTLYNHNIWNKFQQNSLIFAFKFLTDWRDRRGVANSSPYPLSERYLCYRNSLDNNCLNVISFASYRFLYKRRLKQYCYFHIHLSVCFKCYLLLHWNAHVLHPQSPLMHLYR